MVIISKPQTKKIMPFLSSMILSNTASNVVLDACQVYKLKESHM